MGSDRFIVHLISSSVFSRHPQNCRNKFKTPSESYKTRCCPRILVYRSPCNPTASCI